MLDWDNADFERHPALRGYAPGWYMCKCAKCKKTYQGDKRSFNCYQCAKQIDA